MYIHTQTTYIYNIHKYLHRIIAPQLWYTYSISELAFQVACVKLDEVQGKEAPTRTPTIQLRSDFQTGIFFLFKLIV
jgi:hypothetical protein